jgi:hypothetical protein
MLMTGECLAALVRLVGPVIRRNAPESDAFQRSFEQPSPQRDNAEPQAFVPNVRQVVDDADQK